MSILIRKLGGREYAYEVVREGRRVRHLYLGRADDRRVAARVNDLKELNSIPARLKPFFWDTDYRKIDLRRHRRYIIERILEIGNYSAFRWLQRIYPGRLIGRVNEESRAVSPRSKNFWRMWLNG